MTIIFAAWWIPTIITIVCILAAILHNDGGGYFSGLGNILMLVPALGVSLIAWIVYAIFK